MEMKVIDTVAAGTLEKGDFIGVWDQDLQSYQPYEVLSFDDLGDKIVITLDWLEQPMVVSPDKRLDLYGY